MITHENVGVHRNAVFVHDVAQEVMEVVSIDVINEDRTAVYPALGNVKRGTGKLEARTTRHAASLA